MPICHVCNVDNATVRNTRYLPDDHACQYCFETRKPKLLYCRGCYWWEVAPMPAGGLDAALVGDDDRPPVRADDEGEGLMIQPCVDRRPGVNRRRVLRNRRARHLDELADVCELIRGQRDNAAWKAKCLEALQVYDYSYHKDDYSIIDEEDEEEAARDRRKAAKKSERKAHQRMMHALIVVYLSAHSKCSDPSDEWLQRFDAPAFGARHLEHCIMDTAKHDRLAHAQHALRGSFIPDDKTDIAKAVLGHNVVERFLKNRYDVATANRELANRWHGLPRADWPEAFIRSVIVYHACTASGTLEQDRPDAFDPVYAAGYLTNAHYQTLYGSATLLRSDRKSCLLDEHLRSLGTLYGTLLGNLVPPTIARFPAGVVAAGLTNNQQDFLKSLPMFDHVGAAVAGQASACEKNVRKRVLHRLKELFGADGVWNPSRLASDYHEGKVSPEVIYKTHRAFYPSLSRLSNELRADFRQVFADYFLGRVGALTTGPPFLGTSVVTVNQGQGYGGGHDGTITCTVTTAGVSQVGAAEITIAYSRDQPANDGELELPVAVPAENIHVVGESFHLVDGVLLTFAAGTLQQGDKLTIAVAAPVQAEDARLTSLLDDLVTDMRSDRYWFESSCYMNPVTSFRNRGDPGWEFSERARGEDAEMTPMLRLMTVARPGGWPADFPASCGVPAAPRQAYRCNAARVRAMASDLARTNAADWYSDWRVDKDLTLYGNILVEAADYPILASMALWRRSVAVLPNDIYGKNMFVWDHQHVNLGKAVVTCGDKGFPRRSMLLVLHDLLCSTRNKFGDEWSALAQRNKLRTLERLILHLAGRNVVAPGSWSQLFAARYGANVVFQDTAPVKNHKPRMMDRMNLELHILSPVLVREANTILLCKKLTQPDPLAHWTEADEQAEILDFDQKLALAPTHPTVVKYEFEATDSDGAFQSTALFPMPFELWMSGEAYPPGCEDILTREPGFHGDDPR